MDMQEIETTEPCLVMSRRRTGVRVPLLFSLTWRRVYIR